MSQIRRVLDQRRFEREALAAEVKAMVEENHKLKTENKRLRELLAEAQLDVERLLWIMDNGATEYGILVHEVKRTKPNWPSHDDIRKAIDAAKE